MFKKQNNATQLFTKLSNSNSLFTKNSQNDQHHFNNPSSQPKQNEYKL